MFTKYVNQPGMKAAKKIRLKMTKKTVLLRKQTKL